MLPFEKYITLVLLLLSLLLFVFLEANPVEVIISLTVSITERMNYRK